MRRLALLLVLPFLLVAACGDDSGDDDDAAAASGGTGTIAVKLEPTQGLFTEGFEVGLRFDDPDSGDELHRQLWSDAVAADADPYTATYELDVPAGVVRVGSDVSIGIGPGPEPPDLDAAHLPCELDVDVPDGGTVTVQVAFDDSTPDCLKLV